VPSLAASSQAKPSAAVGGDIRRVRKYSPFARHSPFARCLGCAAWWMARSPMSIGGCGRRWSDWPSDFPEQGLVPLRKCIPLLGSMKFRSVGFQTGCQSTCWQPRINSPSRRPFRSCPSVQPFTCGDGSNASLAAPGSRLDSLKVRDPSWEHSNYRSVAGRSQTHCDQLIARSSQSAESLAWLDGSNRAYVVPKRKLITKGPAQVKSLRCAPRVHPIHPHSRPRH